MAVAAGLFFATLPVGTRFLLTTEPGLDPLALLAVRFGFCAILLWVFGPRRESLLPRGREWPWLVVCVGGLLLSSLMYFFCLRTIPASLAVLLVYTYPALVAVFAHFWFGEPLGLPRIGAFLLTFSGSAVLAGLFGVKLHTAPLSGMFMAVMSGFGYALYSLGCQRLAAGRSAQWINRWLTTAVTLIYLAIRPPVFLFTAPPALIAGGFFLGLVSTFLAFSLYLAAIKLIGATRAALCSSIEMVFVVVLAWIVLGERLSAGQALGGLMVLAGVCGVIALPDWRDPFHKKAKPA